jgi:hypothetical protein
LCTLMGQLDFNQVFRNQVAPRGAMPSARNV